MTLSRKRFQLPMSDDLSREIYRPLANDMPLSKRAERIRQGSESAAPSAERSDATTWRFDRTTEAKGQETFTFEFKIAAEPLTHPDHHLFRPLIDQVVVDTGIATPRFGYYPWMNNVGFNGKEEPYWLTTGYRFEQFSKQAWLGILYHEAGHMVFRHGGSTHEHEFIADEFAAAAGHGPGLIEALLELSRMSMYSLSHVSPTHPASEERIRRIERYCGLAPRELPAESKSLGLRWTILGTPNDG